MTIPAKNLFYGVFDTEKENLVIREPDEMKSVDLEENCRIIETTKQSLDDFIPVLEQAGEWLWEKGIKQWRPGSFKKNRARLEHYVDNGCLVLVYLSDRLAGGCILSTVIPDWPDFPDDAMILSSLVVARFAAGKGLGTIIIDACADAARKRGKQYIYLDCWDGNDFLKSYYQQEGFQMLEAVAEKDYFIRLFVKDLG